MALELRQSLGLTQQLIMTPQLQQAIKLLQLSRLELVETLYEEMETNPLLEEQASVDEEDAGIKAAEESDLPPGESPENPPELREVTVEERAREDVDWENYLSEYNTGWAETQYDSREIPSFENTTSGKTNLHDHLSWQLNMGNFDDFQREIGFHIIGNLNEEGYLDISLEELCGITGQTEARVLETLRIIQYFDPVGVAARDTRECLLIQARFQGLDGTLVERIIMDHLPALEKRRYDQIASRLYVSIPEVQAAVAVIQGLEPKPGRLYTDDETIYIVPDIYVFKVGDEYEITLNEDGLPKLRINGYYKKIMKSRDAVSENARSYINEKLKSAAWLIKSIHQRQRTIYRVTESIFKFQSGFLDHGIMDLKPLVLRDVAEDVEMHESTVSRVTTNKYVHTPQGLFELKFFFNSSVSGLDGNNVSSESVKAYIRNIIKAEDKRNPISDKMISEILRKFNIKIARRTVAKYREAMKVLPSRSRRMPY